MNQQQIPVPLNQTTEIRCSNCNGIFFNLVYTVRKISKIITLTPDDQIIPIPVFVCNECGEVLKDSMPELFNKPEEEKPKAKILNIGDTL